MYIYTYMYVFVCNEEYLCGNACRPCVCSQKAKHIWYCILYGSCYIWRGAVFLWGFCLFFLKIEHPALLHRKVKRQQIVRFCKILGVFLVLKICKPWHIYYYYYYGYIKYLIQPCYACVCVLGKAEEWQKSFGHSCCSHSYCACFCYAGQAQRSVSLKSSGQFMARISEQLQKISMSIHE